MGSNFQLEKTCTSCGSTKLRSDFDGGKAQCRVCYAAVRRKRRADNYQEYRERERAAYDPLKRATKHRNLKRDNRARLLVQQGRGRAKRAGVLFDLDRHEGRLAERLKTGCAMTGLPFDTLANRIVWNSPSLDRIQPGGDYTFENVRVILFCMNTALGNWGEEVLRTAMTAWLKGDTHVAA